MSLVGFSFRVENLRAHIDLSAHVINMSQSGRLCVLNARHFILIHMVLTFPIVFLCRTKILVPKSVTVLYQISRHSRTLLVPLFS